MREAIRKITIGMALLLVLSLFTDCCMDMALLAGNYQ